MTLDVSIEPGAQRLQALAGTLLDVLERTGVAVVASDPTQADQPVVFVNSAFTELTGYAPDEILGRNCRFLQGPRTAPGDVSLLRAGVEAGRDVQGDILNFRKDGGQFWNRVSITAVGGPPGRPELFIATLTDVSIQHGRTGLLGAAGAWEWDIPNERLYADARFAELHGLDAREMALGVATTAFFKRIVPEDLLKVRIAVAGVLHGTEVFSRDFRTNTDDGGVRWISARGRSRINERGEPIRFTGALVDVTDQKRVEEQLLVAQTAGGIGSFEYLSGFGTAAVSGEFCRLLGLHVADALPVRTINSVVRPEDPPIIAAWRPDQKGVLPYTEMRILRADNGEERWLARRGELRPEGGPTGLRFVGVVSMDALATAIRRMMLG